MRLIAPLLLAASLSACVSQSGAYVPQAPPPRPTSQTNLPPPTQPAPPPVQGFRAPEIMRGPGLDGVIREAAPGLVRQFGTPRLDTAEGDMRKLQFATNACVMDIYLYPLQPGADPVATWVETRRSSDGATVDMVACMQAIRGARR